MNIWKALTALQAAGNFLARFGVLLKRLGEAIAGPNLGPDDASPVVDNEARPQDPPAHGAEDEKPEGMEPDLFFIERDFRKPPQ